MPNAFWVAFAVTLTLAIVVSAALILVKRAEKARKKNQERWRERAEEIRHRRGPNRFSIARTFDISEADSPDKGA